MTQFIKEPFSPMMPVQDPTVLCDGEAYIRADLLDGENVWSIFDAEGEKLGHANSREMAMAVALQNDLTPFSVH